MEGKMTTMLAMQVQDMQRMGGMGNLYGYNKNLRVRRRTCIHH